MDEKELQGAAPQMNKDERTQQYQVRGMDYGRLLFALVTLLVVLFDLWKGVAPYGALGTYCAFLAGASIQPYRFTRSKYYLGTLVVSGAAAAAFLALHVAVNW